MSTPTPFEENAYESFVTATPEPPPVVNPDDPPWGVGAAFLVWLASVALLFFIQVIAVIPYILYRYRGSDAEQIQTAIRSDSFLILISLISAIPAHLLTLLIVWALVTRYGKRPFWPTIGWSWSERVGFWTSTLLAIGLLAVGVGLTSLFGDVKTPFDEMLQSSTSAKLTTAFLATATAPLVEELVYRGVLYPAMQRGITRLVMLLKVLFTAPREALHTVEQQFGPPAPEGRILRFLMRALLSVLTFFKRLSPERSGMVWGVLLVGSLFTVVHVAQYYNNPAVIAAVGMLGFVLTYVRARTGRLLPCFVIHLVFNGIQCVGLVLEHFRPQETGAAVATLSNSLAQTAHAFGLLIR